MGAAAAATVVKRVRRPEHAQDLCVPLQQSQLCVAMFSVCLRRTKRMNERQSQEALERETQRLLCVSCDVLYLACFFNSVEGGGEGWGFCRCVCVL